MKRKLLFFLIAIISLSFFSLVSSWEPVEPETLNITEKIIQDFNQTTTDNIPTEQTEQPETIFIFENESLTVEKKPNQEPISKDQPVELEIDLSGNTVNITVNPFSNKISGVHIIMRSDNSIVGVDFHNVDELMSFWDDQESINIITVAEETVFPEQEFSLATIKLDGSSENTLIEKVIIVDNEENIYHTKILYI